MRARRAFTLIELLVVIAIIMLIVSMLMPALAYAKSQAVRVKCAAHLSQIAQAVAMYSGEWKGAIPMAYVYPAPGWPRGYHWTDHLGPYLQRQVGQDETAAGRDRSVIWGCPAWLGPADPDPNNYWGKPWNSGYGYNCQPLMPSIGNGNNDFLMTNRDIGYIGRYFKLSEIRYHSARGMVADAKLVYIGAGYAWDRSKPDQLQQYGNVTPTRHGNWGSVAGVNVLFYDGHVQAQSARDAHHAFRDPMRTEGQ